MLDVLTVIEADLPALLDDEEGWNSLDINYHPPRMVRLWRTWGSSFRVSLHRIHPCTIEDALFHPHPWPSAMRVCDGTYEMAVGYGSGAKAPPIAARLISSGDLRYEMLDINAWHGVRPIGKVAMTVMVTGMPWKREATGDEPYAPLLTLDPENRREMLAWFRAFYDRKWLNG